MGWMWRESLRLKYRLCYKALMKLLWLFRLWLSTIYMLECWYFYWFSWDILEVLVALMFLGQARKLWTCAIYWSSETTCCSHPGSLSIRTNREWCNFCWLCAPKGVQCISEKRFAYRYVLIFLYSMTTVLHQNCIFVFSFSFLWWKEMLFPYANKWVQCKITSLLRFGII